MERTTSSSEVEKLIETVENSMSAVIRDYGHIDNGYCLACDDEPFEALRKIREIVLSRPNWPKELHKQYLSVLDERDKLQERVDELEARCEPKGKIVWKLACIHGVPNFVHCPICDK